MDKQASPSGAPQKMPKFQTMDEFMEEFMEEQDKLDAVRSPPAPSNPPPSKRIRRTIDVEAIALEARALDEIGDTNWIGRLLEYRVVNPPMDGLKYIDAIVGAAPPRFVCSAALAESSQPFGDTVSFIRKKDAKQFASKKAIDWLIENTFMPSVGVKLPKSKAVNKPAAIPKTPSLAGQIPELCKRLGFTAPTYEITRVSEEAPLYSGFAHFNDDPRIDGKIGEVEEIFGRKNAKDMIVQELATFLRDIERQRNASEVFYEVEN